MTVPYVLDDRTAAAVLAELRARAVATEVPGLRLPASTPASGPGDPVPWSELLFDGDAVRSREPSAALLDAVAQLAPGLLAHLSTLPDRALVDWLERRLGIPRLPVLPDRVVAVPTADPKALPVVMPVGTALRGGRDMAGNERRYVTTETLTILGTAFLGARSYRVSGSPPDESMAEWLDPAKPFEPFPPDVAVPHTLDIVSDVLAFEGGELWLRLDFGSQAIPDDLRWSYSTATGLADAVVTGKNDAIVDLLLKGSCSPLPGDPAGLPFIQVALPEPPLDERLFDLRLDEVSAKITIRDVLPDAAFYNDGVVDITKEFQPFGPIPKRGDSFYLQSEEAFGKPLESLKVKLDVLGEDGLYEVAWGPGLPSYVSSVVKLLNEQQALNFYTTIGGDKTRDPGASRIAWQRNDGGWGTFEETPGAFRSIDVDGLSPVGEPAGSTVPARSVHSRPATVGGVTGRMIRAFLDRGDFGWTDYQDRIAHFAQEAAKTGGTPSKSDLIPPDPPIVTKLTLTYETKPVRATRLRARNGWATRDLERGDRLFSIPLGVADPVGGAAEIGIGLDLRPVNLGATVSLFVEIDAAAACTTNPTAPVLSWECWTSGLGWRPIDVVDGTAGLRQAGLIRFIAPLDWAIGCPDLSEDVGRWLRIVTNQPERLGTVRAVVPDAVTAEYQSRLPDPTVDATPATPLKPKELKGLLVPIVGIKKVTNLLAGSVGRGPESDAAYTTRAAERTRHRNRAVQAWDYEAIVRSEFPEVATVRCLPHTGPSGDDEPGSVGIVVVPYSDDLRPAPSVTLAERIEAALRDRLPVHARPVVLCPLYQGVTIEAKIVLRPTFSAAESKISLAAAIDASLHPGVDAAFGRELFGSTLVRFLESRPEVDHVTTFLLVADPCPTGATGAPCVVERVMVDPCRGLVASAGNHVLTLTEQL